MNWYFKVLRQYANFHGRARRKEYFYFLVINKLMFTGFHKLGDYLNLHFYSLKILDNVFTFNWLGTIYVALVLVPAIAVGARRVQDTNKPGLYGFLFPYSIYLVLKAGDKGKNKYGVSPK